MKRIFLIIMILYSSLSYSIVTGNVNLDQVILTWITASEINNSYFTVERSIDANSWEEILKVDDRLKSLVTLEEV